MKKYLFSVLILTLPAFGTITNIQSAAYWSCTSLSGNTVTCAVNTTTHTTGGHLLAVWTFWQPGSFPYTAAVSDTATPLNTFYSAVGPTVQSAASTLTSAQIFYAANINPSTGDDTITVTFTCLSTLPACTSPSISQAGVVAVEYSGADQSYPLDSVSAGYSTASNMTNLLDGGNVAPANSNLLVFGGGFADPNLTTTAGSGFTKLQASNSSWGTGLVEDNSAAISGNNVLQRATACIGSVAACPGTTAGNWLMQMAVFRDASWTVGGGWSPARFAQILDASQFPGVDIGDQVNHAYAALPATGGHIVIPAKADGSCYNFITPIVLNTPGKYVLLEHAGAGGAVVTVPGSPGPPPASTMSTGVGCLNYTPTTGTAITLDYALSTAGGQSTSSVHGLRNIELVNHQCITTLGCSANSATIGIDFGDGSTNQGVQGATMENVSVAGFGTDVRNINFYSDPVLWINPQMWDSQVCWDVGNVSTTTIIGGEFDGCIQMVLADATGGVMPSGRSELHFIGTTFVGNSAYFNYNNVTGLPAYLYLTSVHFENGQSASAPAHFIQGDVNVFAVGVVAENDSSVCTSADWYFNAGGYFFQMDQLTVQGGCNPSVGVVQDSSDARCRVSGFNANPGVITKIVGGMKAALCTVEMSNGNLTNNASTWNYESPQQFNANVTLGTQLNQTAANNFAGSCTMTAGMTCTFTSIATFSTGYLCFPSFDHASGLPLTVVWAICAISGNTVTITASANNSLTWDALLIGNPN